MVLTGSKNAGNATAAAGQVVVSKSWIFCEPAPLKFIVLPVMV